MSSSARRRTETVTVASRQRTGRPRATTVARVPRRPRKSLPDPGVFQVTARGVNKSAIVFDDVDRHALKELVIRTERRFGWRYDVFCIMTTHFHLVLPAALDPLSAGMHWLNGVWAQRINRRYSRTGHLFENRFSAWVIGDERHWEATCRYVLENPVRAGLCDSPRDWPWSGGRFFERYRP